MRAILHHGSQMQFLDLQLLLSIHCEGELGLAHTRRENMRCVTTEYDTAK